MIPFTELSKTRLCQRILLLFYQQLCIISVGCSQTGSSIPQIENIEPDSNNAISINGPLDLGGKMLVVPNGCTIVFDRQGVIKNGWIRGNNSKIGGDKKKGIFDNIRIEGSWIVPRISTKMFKKVDVNTPSNISSLSSAYCHNTIIVEDRLVVPILEFSSPFIIKSNTDIYLKADMQSLPTDFRGGYVMMVRGNNVNIYGGGHKLTGTIRKSSKNKEQWQHGLCINIDASKVYVEKLICNEFWGDGIYSRGSNVTINDVTCLYNGRQGLSITYGENVVVKNSVFRHTGKYGLNNSNGPGAGIDIEPNSKDYVRNILVENCVLTDNSTKTFGDSNDLEIFRAPNSSIKLVNCTIGGVYIGTSSDIVFDDCTIVKPIYGINEDVSKVKIKRTVPPVIDSKISKNVLVE